MAKFIARNPTTQSYSDAIAKAIPIFAQSQQLKVQQAAQNARLKEQMDFQRQQRESDRAQKLQIEYGKQAAAMRKEQKKIEDDRNKSIYKSSGDADNWTISQRKAFDMLASYVSENNLGENETEFQSSLSELTTLADLFNKTNESLEGREEEFAGYATEPDSYNSDTMYFSGGEKELNTYNSIRSRGGFDVETMTIEDGKPVADWLDANGQPLYVDGIKARGSIYESPFYSADSIQGLYSIEANIRERSDMPGSSYLQEIAPLVEMIESDPKLSTSERTEKLKGLLTNSFGDLTTLDANGKNAYSTAIKQYLNRNYPNNPNKVLSEEEKSEAVSSYVNEVVSLYQPETSITETGIQTLDYWEKRLLPVWNKINNNPSLDKETKDKRWLTALNSFTSESNIGETDLDKAFKNTARMRWEDDNPGNTDYNFDEAMGSLKEALLEEVPPFSEKKAEKTSTGRAPTQTQIAKNQRKEEAFNQVKEIEAWVMPTEFDLMDNPTYAQINFNPNIESSATITMTDFNEPLQLSSYLSDDYSTGKEINKFEKNEAGETVAVKVPGPRLNVEAKPQAMTLLNTDQGIVVELKNWTGIKNVSGGRAIPPVYINPIMNKDLYRAIDAELQRTRGVSFTELQREFIKSIGGL
jgi:hypothetical protein